MKRLTEHRECGYWPKDGWSDKALIDRVDQLGKIEDIFGSYYKDEVIEKVVEFFAAIPHICKYCVGCELEPTDGHGCKKSDNFVLSVPHVVEAISNMIQEDSKYPTAVSGSTSYFNTYTDNEEMCLGVLPNTVTDVDNTLRYCYLKGRACTLATSTGACSVTGCTMSVSGEIR